MSQEYWDKLSDEEFITEFEELYTWWMYYQNAEWGDWSSETSKREKCNDDFRRMNIYRKKIRNIPFFDYEKLQKSG